MINKKNLYFHMAGLDEMKRLSCNKKGQEDVPQMIAQVINKTSWRKG